MDRYILLTYEQWSTGVYDFYSYVDAKKKHDELKKDNPTLNMEIALIVYPRVVENAEAL